MKLSFKNRTIILFCIGLIFIVSGIFQAVTKITMDPKVSKYMESGLLILAALVYFMGREKKDEKDDDVKEDEEVK